MNHQRQLTPIDPEAVTEVCVEAPSDELLRLVTEAFQALADPTRAKMLYALIRRSLCVRDLAIVVGVSESAISHQLRLLRGWRLVKSQSEGNVIHWPISVF